MLYSFNANIYHLPLATARASWGTVDTVGRFTGAAPAGLVQDTNVGSVKIDLNSGSNDVSMRDGGGFKQFAPGLFDLESLVIPQRYAPTDVFYLACLQAMLTRKPIALAILDGLVATVGAEGWWASFMVDKGAKSEEIEKIQMWEWSFKLTVDPATPSVPPQRIIVTG